MVRGSKRGEEGEGEGGRGQHGRPTSTAWWRLLLIKKGSGTILSSSGHWERCTFGESTFGFVGVMFCIATCPEKKVSSSQAPALLLPTTAFPPARGTGSLTLLQALQGSSREGKPPIHCVAGAECGWGRLSHTLCRASKVSLGHTQHKAHPSTDQPGATTQESPAPGSLTHQRQRPPKSRKPLHQKAPTPGGQAPRAQNSRSPQAAAALTLP